MTAAKLPVEETERGDLSKRNPSQTGSNAVLWPIIHTHFLSTRCPTADRQETVGIARFGLLTASRGCQYG